MSATLTRAPADSFCLVPLRAPVHHALIRLTLVAVRTRRVLPLLLLAMGRCAEEACDTIALHRADQRALAVRAGDMLGAGLRGHGAGAGVVARGRAEQSSTGTRRSPARRSLRNNAARAFAIAHSRVAGRSDTILPRIHACARNGTLAVVAARLAGETRLAGRLAVGIAADSRVAGTVDAMAARAIVGGIALRAVSVLRRIAGSGGARRRFRGAWSDPRGARASNGAAVAGGRHGTRPRFLVQAEDLCARRGCERQYEEDVAVWRVHVPTFERLLARRHEQETRRANGRFSIHETAGARARLRCACDYAGWFYELSSVVGASAFARFRDPRRSKTRHAVRSRVRFSWAR